nr:hypothetical protein [Tanacetum cinerariifolium]
MVAYLNKSDSSDGFNQVIDFLNASYIKYALTINPHIYVSCIKQFWNTVVVKQSNDVTRLQALVDKKKVLIMEATIRDALRLDDAEGWKFLIHTILQSLSAKRTSWNEFSSAMASAVICLSTGVIEERGDAEEQVQDVAANIAAQGADTAILGDDRIGSSDDTVMEDASNQGRMIDALDSDAGVTLMDDKEDEKKVKEANVAVRVAAASTRRRKGVVIRDLEEESTTIIPAETKSKDKGKGIMVEEPKPMKKKQQVEMDEEYARKLYEDLNKDIDWDVAIDHNLEIVPDEDDDVYTEATALARKVPVVDYEIIHVNNKPHYKIIRVDGTHQLSPNNFSDDFMLTTLGAMFERPDGQAQVWKSQRTIHGQAKVKSWKLLESCGVHIITFTTTQLILLVERRYPLSRFTLDQMLNAVWLRVEEQSEMSLELLSFGVDATIDLEEKHQVFNAAGEGLSAAKQNEVDNEEYDCINKEMYSDVNVELKDTELKGEGKDDEEMTNAGHVDAEHENINQEVTGDQVKDDAQKRTLFKMMTKTKSFNENTKNKDLYHALMEFILKDEDAMDKGVTDKTKKRKPDDADRDEGPPAGSNQGLKRKKISKDVEPSKKAKSTETFKDTTKS